MSELSFPCLVQTIKANANPSESDLNIINDIYEAIGQALNISNDSRFPKPIDSGLSSNIINNKKLPSKFLRESVNNLTKNRIHQLADELKISFDDALTFEAKSKIKSSFKSRIANDPLIKSYIKDNITALFKEDFFLILSYLLVSSLKNAKLYQQGYLNKLKPSEVIDQYFNRAGYVINGKPFYNFIVWFDYDFSLGNGNITLPLDRSLTNYKNLNKSFNVKLAKNLCEFPTLIGNESNPTYPHKFFLSKITSIVQQEDSYLIHYRNLVRLSHSDFLVNYWKVTKLGHEIGLDKSFTHSQWLLMQYDLKQILKDNGH